MKNFTDILAKTITTLLGTFTASAIVYTWCYAIVLYTL